MSINTSGTNVAHTLAGKRGGRADNKLISESSSFHVREAFKTIRTNLRFALATSDKKSIVIASAMPNEGKSTASANLAIVLAQTGAQVLLMDCDLRKPTVHRLFRLTTGKGVTSILCGIDTIEQALHENVAPNLDIITAGPLSPNPSELLGSSRMKDLLDIVQKAYDYVILDASPMNLVSDAVIVAKQTAGVVLIVRQDQSRHEHLQKCIESCEFAGVNILGIIVNESRSSKSYHYGYVYEYSKKTDRT